MNANQTGFVLIAAVASEPEASEQGSNPNLYMREKIWILPLVPCIMVPVGFYHNAKRSVTLKCTCVVTVWSFLNTFHEGRGRFLGRIFDGFLVSFHDYVDI